eukprot:1181879-Prorocentrum_minimum.AAC.2
MVRIWPFTLTRWLNKVLTVSSTVGLRSLLKASPARFDRLPSEGARAPLDWSRFGFGTAAGANLRAGGGASDSFQRGHLAMGPLPHQPHLHLRNEHRRCHPGRHPRRNRADAVSGEYGSPGGFAGHDRNAAVREHGDALRDPNGAVGVRVAPLGARSSYYYALTYRVRVSQVPVVPREPHALALLRAIRARALPGLLPGGPAHQPHLHAAAASPATRVHQRGRLRGVSQKKRRQMGHATHHARAVLPPTDAVPATHPGRVDPAAAQKVLGKVGPRAQLGEVHLVPVGRSRPHGDVPLARLGRGVPLLHRDGGHLGHVRVRVGLLHGLGAAATALEERDAQRQAAAVLPLGVFWVHAAEPCAAADLDRHPHPGESPRRQLPRVLPLHTSAARVTARVRTTPYGPPSRPPSGSPFGTPSEPQMIYKHGLNYDFICFYGHMPRVKQAMKSLIEDDYWTAPPPPWQLLFVPPPPLPCSGSCIEAAEATRGFPDGCCMLESPPHLLRIEQATKQVCRALKHTPPLREPAGRFRCFYATTATLPVVPYHRLFVIC